METNGNKRFLRELASPCHGKSWNYPPFPRKSPDKGGGGYQTFRKIKREKMRFSKKREKQGFFSKSINGYNCLKVV